MLNYRHFLRMKLLIFGDIQYANIRNAFSFDGSTERHYRKSLDLFKSSLLSRCHNSNPAYDFIVNLGDVIDGKVIQCEEYSEMIETLVKIKNVLCIPNVPVVNLIGNHELYVFTREFLLNNEMIPCTSPFDAYNRSSYYSFTKQGVKFIVLDSYDLSLMRSGGGRPGHELVMEEDFDQNSLNRIRMFNSSDFCRNDVDYFVGLSREQKCWVPFNGGVGEDQLQWLKREVESNLPLCIFCHTVLHPKATPDDSYRTLCWNWDEIFHILDNANTRVVVFSGHAHNFKYYKHSNTLCFITLASTLEKNYDCIVELEVTADNKFVIAANDGMGNVHSVIC